MPFFFFIIRIFGKGPAYACLTVVVFVYVACYPSVRKSCRPYLTRRFPGSGRLGLLIHSYRLVLTFGRILVDNAAMGILGQDCIRADFSSPEEYRRIKDLDTGCIILMSHVGCWQVAISALSRLNRPVNLLMLARDSRAEALSAGGRLKIIAPDQFLGGTLDMLNVLKNDEILCIMGDRLFGNSAYALDMEFLGGRAQFPFSAYKLAATARRPIVILNTAKTGYKTYELSLPDIINVPPKAGKKAEAFKAFAGRYVDSLARYTEKHPYQFFNFFDLWAGTGSSDPGSVRKGGAQ